MFPLPQSDFRIWTADAACSSRSKRLGDRQKGQPMPQSRAARTGREGGGSADLHVAGDNSLAFFIA